MVKIILSTCSINARFFFIIDQNHVVAFSPPASLEMKYRKITTDIMTTSFCVQHQEILFPVKIRNTVNFRRVYAKIISPSTAWQITSPSGLKISNIRSFFMIKLIINMEKQTKWSFIFIDHLYFGPFVKRHRKITIHRSSSTKSQLFTRS